MISLLNLARAGVGQGFAYDLSALAAGYTDQDSSTTTFKVVFLFRVTTDGTVDVDRNVEADLPDEAIYVTPAAGALGVRCTQNSGTALNVGDTVGSWVSLTPAQARSFGLSYTSGGGPDQVVANIDLEISTDSGGSSIVASKAGIDLTVGETA